MPLYPESFERTYILSQFETIDIEITATIASVGGVVIGLTICSDKQGALAVNRVDRVTQVYWLRPTTVGLFPCVKKIIVAIARPEVGSEIKCLVVGMYKGTLFITRRIHRRTQVLRVTPSAVSLQMAYINIFTSVTSGPGA